MVFKFWQFALRKLISKPEQMTDFNSNAKLTVTAQTQTIKKSSIKINGTK